MPPLSALTVAFKTLLSSLEPVASDRARELLRGVRGRGGFVPRLERWLAENAAAFPEPFKVDDTDGVNDRGVDVLVVGARTGVRIGFQVKSDGDVSHENFTQKLKAQIHDATHLGVTLIVVVFACDPEKHTDKIKYWLSLSNTLSLGPEVICVSPERAARLYHKCERPLPPIVIGDKTWPELFAAVGKPELQWRHLDPWPRLLPHQRFLAPEGFASIRDKVRQKHLTVLLGPPAAGKTFLAMQLLWEAFLAGRPVHWVTAHDLDRTEGPIAAPEPDLVEKQALRSQIGRLIRTLGPKPGQPPVDRHDFVSHFLSPDALVYVEDPFGKRDGEYELSLAGYDFFDLHFFVETLERESARAGCQIVVSSREALFQRWLGDLRAHGREAPPCAVVRLAENGYAYRPLLEHATLLAGERDFEDPSAIAEVLLDHVATPFEVELLIGQLAQLPSRATPADAEREVTGWVGDLRTKVERAVKPRHEGDVLMLLLVAAAASTYERLHKPAAFYAKLCRALGLGNDAEAFDAVLARLRAFLVAHGDDPRSPPMTPCHTVVEEAIRDVLAAPDQQLLLRRILNLLPTLPSAERPRRRREGIFDFAYLIDPWHDHFVIALYLIGLGVVGDAADEAQALGDLLLERVDARSWRYRQLVEVWDLLPRLLRERIRDKLRAAPNADQWVILDAAGCLPRARIAGEDAWWILRLLFETRSRGRMKTMYQESPWAYAFLHLDELPQDIRERLDAWARQKPGSFVQAMDEGLLLHWDAVPETWRACLSRLGCDTSLHVIEALVSTTARYWLRAPQLYRDLYGELSRCPQREIRELVGSRSLLYADRHGDLEGHAMAVIGDKDAAVPLVTLRWGTGDAAHQRFAEALLASATPGVAAEMLRVFLAEKGRETLADWEPDFIRRCETAAGDAGKAAITFALMDGDKRAVELGYQRASSPWNEAEIVRAVWLWQHVSSARESPLLTEAELKTLLQGLHQPGIRDYCLFYTSYRSNVLPDGVAPFLEELAAGSKSDAEAVRAGAAKRGSIAKPLSQSFPLWRMLAWESEASGG